MRANKKISRRKNEQGIIITLVAVFMLGVIGAMAALSIDLVTIYTARSEAQLAADAGALAGARVLANSGMTSSSTTTIGDNAVPLAVAVANRVAASSLVGGRNLVPGATPCTAGQEINVCIPTTGPNFIANPQVTVTVQRTDLPTFFARIWGTKQVKISASATAEAYNPSYLAGTAPLPVAPSCVKPWLLPNIDPSNANNTIFAPNGAITSPTTLLGWVSYTPKLRSNCTTTTTCTLASSPNAWWYYPGTTDPADPLSSFPAPAAASCTGCTGYSSYQLAIAGCVQTPIPCNKQVNIDQTTVVTDQDTSTAVDTLAHTANNGGDNLDLNPAPPPGGTAPFQFQAGSDNPLVLSGALTAQSNLMVSDSLVTVPVIDVTTTNWPPTSTTFPTVQIIGFVQLLLNPNGSSASGSAPPYHIVTQVINLVGCGTAATGGATGQPILGNGASAVAVRLISPS